MRNIRSMPISGCTGALRGLLVITAASLTLAGCGGGSMFGGG